MSQQTASFAAGCFWGVEARFLEVDGVADAVSGYQGGHLENPTYKQVCGGDTGHAEVVRVVFDPATVSFDDLLRIFWEAHDPTQGMRQGNDIGSQYRSAIYAVDEAQLSVALSSRDAYQASLTAAGHAEITTEIRVETEFHLAEDSHQQYLAKNPAGYCGIGGTGVACPIGPGAAG